MIGEDRGLNGNSRVARKPSPVFVWVMLGFFFIVGGPGKVEAKENAKNFLGSSADKDETEVDGFRSARFGMTENEVLKAIFRDFNISRSRIKHQVHPTEKTNSLEVVLRDLLPDSGPARAFYIFGYKSKKLIHVNLIWGRPATEKPDPQGVVNTANQLRDHFLRKKFQEEGRMLNTPLKDGSILVFRGQDKKGRVAALLLMNPQSKDLPPNQNISLRLSYIENPVTPDIFRVGAKEF